MAQFTWVPDYGAQNDVKPRVRSVKFGDGYEQRRADGINSVAESWSLSFENRDDDESDAIMDFLRDKAGVEYFEWTPPNELVEKKYVCKEWSRVRSKPNLSTITATFSQVFDP